MDSISNAELIELILLQRQNVDFQFQFWLSITFALVAAIFAAQNRVSMPLKLMVATLYFLATTAIVGRTLLEGIELVNYITEAMDRQLIPDPSAIPLYARTLVVLIGTIGSIIYLFTNSGYEATDDA